MSEKEKTQSKSMVVQSKQPGLLHSNLTYFPAWSVIIDGKKQTPVFSPTGMDIQVPSGTHTVHVIFQQTPVEKIADIISIIGILLLFADIIGKRRNFFD